MTLAIGTLISLSSCSDGTQISTKVKTLIQENGIEKVKIQGGCSGSATELPSTDLIVGSQFKKFNNQYFNLGKVNAIKVKGNTLELSF